jgi:hypothetical protein|nr:MAG TPA: Large subunit terminase [Caudoviricetes sp.]
MDINYKVLPTFAKIHQDPGPYIFVMGPVGSGKSSGCIFQAFLNAMRQKPDKDGVRHSRHLVIRATYPALKSTTINSWIDWFKDKITITYSTPIVGKIRYPLSDGTTVDMIVYFIAVDDDRSAEKLRSLEVTSAHLNEASELTLNTFQIVKTRVGRFPAAKDGGPVRPFIIFDYNAVSTEHWLYKLAEEQKPEGHHFYRQPPAVLKIDGQYVVNPDAENLANLSEDYYKNIIMGSDDDFISVNLMNNYGEIKRGRPVYKDYVDVQHYSSEPLKPLHGVPVVIGIDFGLCYTDKIRVLTNHGWKYFEDVDVKVDKVLSRNPTNGEIAWVKPNFKVKEWHDGPMLRFSTFNAKFEVTPEHRIPVTTATSTDVRFMTAQEAMTSPGRKYVDVTSVNTQACPKTLFGYDAEALVRMLGWYLSEGSADKNINRVTIANNNTDNLKTIAELVTRLGCAPNIAPKSVRFSDAKLKKLLSPTHALFDTKRVPLWMYHIGAPLIEAFIESFTQGDGYVRVRANGSIEETCSTSSTYLRDDLIALAQLAGYYASWSATPPRKHWYEKEQRYIVSTRDNYIIRFKKRAKRVALLKPKWEEFHYTGYRYCLNVPWHTLYIMQDGTPSWNGNTPSAVFTQQQPDGSVIVFDEICTENCGIQEFSKDYLWPRITTKYPHIMNNFTCVCDPAAAQRSINDAKASIQVLKEAGLPVKLARSNVFTERREAVIYFLRMFNKFKLGPDCPMLRKGFISEYKYDAAKTVDGVLYKEKPTKNEYSHPHDALQYAMMEYVHKRNRNHLFRERRKYTAASQIGGY